MVRGFLALGGSPRRHGRTQLEKRIGLDPGSGLGANFERISAHQRSLLPKVTLACRRGESEPGGTAGSGGEVRSSRGPRPDTVVASKVWDSRPAPPWALRLLRPWGLQGSAPGRTANYFEEAKIAINIDFRRSARISWIGVWAPPGGASGATPGALRAPGRGVRRRSRKSARTSESF